MYICNVTPCKKVTFISQSGPACLIEFQGNQFLVKCEHLQESCDQPTGNELANFGQQASLVKHQRVLLMLKDEASKSTRAWPAAIKAVHANGRVSLALDGLGGRVNADEKDILPIETITSYTNGI